MTTNPSIWRIEGNELVEQPTLSEPKYQWKNEIERSSEYWELIDTYNKHLASLRRYAHNLPDSLKGKDLREGQHFRLQHQWFVKMHPDLGSWENCTEDDYAYTNHERKRIIALPISQPEQPISEEGKEFKQLLKRYVTDFALMLQAGENIRSMYEHYEKGNRLSIEKLMLLATPSQEAIEFAEWAGIEMWQYDLGSKIWMKAYDDGIHDQYTTKELYQIYLEHKNSKS